MCGEPAYETQSGSACKNGHGGADFTENPPAKKTVQEKLADKMKQKVEEKPKAKVEFDYSSIDPEKEWACFGTFDGTSSECTECPFKGKCEAKKTSK